MPRPGGERERGKGRGEEGRGGEEEIELPWAHGAYPALDLERRIKRSSLNGECIGLDPDSREMFGPGTAVSCSWKLLDFLNEGLGPTKWPICLPVMGPLPC